MTVPRILSASPGLVLLGLILGLALSFAFRRKPWIVFVWLPTASTFAYGAYLVLRRLSALGKVHGGPDAGFAGMEAMFHLPVLGLCIAGLVVSFICRPRKEARRFSTAIPACAIYLALVLLSDRQNATTIEIQLFNAAGKPIPGVRVQYRLSEGGVGMQAKLLSSDADGKFSLALRQGQNIGLEIMPSPSSPQDLDTSPTFWNLELSPLENSPEQLAVRHHWQRSVANQTLNEGFTEVISRSPQINLSLTLPDHASLDPGPRRERIRAAFVAFRKNHPPGLSYAYLCRNVEAIEFIPQLIEAYRNKEAGSEGVVDGLAQIAEILSELERGCREVQRRVKSEPHYPRQMLQNQITQFCIWAGIPEDSRADVPQALERVQEKIAAHAKELSDFVFGQMQSDPGVIKVLSELRRSGHSLVPRFVEAVRANPPKEMRTVYQWSHSLWMIGSHFSDLGLLYASDDPLVVMVAFEATPNDEMEGSIAAKALERFEAVYPNITETQIRQRADMHMQMLRARLK